MRLVYKGKICKDPDVLKALNVADGHMVHVVRCCFRSQAKRMYVELALNRHLGIPNVERKCESRMTKIPC